MAISARTSTMSLGAIACVVRVVVNQVDAITIHRVIVRRGRRAARAQTAPYRPIPTLRLARVCPPQFPVPSPPPPPLAPTRALAPSHARAHFPARPAPIQPTRRDRVALFIVSPPPLGFAPPFAILLPPPLPPQMLVAMAICIRVA
jgi:hypothetical protein